MGRLVPPTEATAPASCLARDRRKSQPCTLAPIIHGEPAYRKSASDESHELMPRMPLNSRSTMPLASSTFGNASTRTCGCHLLFHRHEPRALTYEKPVSTPTGTAYFNSTERSIARRDSYPSNRFNRVNPRRTESDYVPDIGSFHGMPCG